MKRFFTPAVALVLILSLTVMALVACEFEKDPEVTEDEGIEISYNQVYAYAQEAGFKGTLEDLIAAFKGDSAYEVAVANGYQGTEMEWLNSLVGATGKDGVTPHIGDNYNWFIGDLDTGICARGKDGENGTNGENGKDGKDYERADIKVTFNANGGTIENYSAVTLTDIGSNCYTASIKEGEAISILPTPTKQGYTFEGWSTGNSVNDGQWFNKYNFTQNTTLYARWSNAVNHIYYTRDGDYIYFGSYPQSEVTDDILKSTLTASAGTLPTNGNNQNWTSYKYYIEGDNTTDYMWYQDIEYNNEKFRGVYFTSYRPYFTDYSNSTEDSNQDDNGYTTGTIYWFKYEPIKWRILEESNGYATILAELILDSQDYNYTRSNKTIGENTVYSNNYKYSSIRAWLNDTFYNTAFTSLQQELIQTVTVYNSARSTNTDRNASEWNNGVNKYACDNTNDKIWLLSEQEVTRSAYGFATNPDTFDTVRRKAPSAYAKCQGAYTYGGSGYYGMDWWWLRSPYYDSNSYASSVYFSGYSHNFYSVYDTRGGVVPALKIRIS